jgi:hypothetical protein
MANKTRIALAAALIAAVLAPAVAQAQDHTRLFHGRNSAVFAVPGVPGYINPNSPAATGGGSTGYNARVEEAN